MQSGRLRIYPYNNEEPSARLMLSSRIMHFAKKGCSQRCIPTTIYTELFFIVNLKMDSIPSAENCEGSTGIRVEDLSKESLWSSSLAKVIV